MPTSRPVDPLGRWISRQNSVDEISASGCDASKETAPPTLHDLRSLSQGLDAGARRRLWLLALTLCDGGAAVPPLEAACRLEDFILFGAEPAAVDNSRVCRRQAEPVPSAWCRHGSRRRSGTGN